MITEIAAASTELLKLINNQSSQPLEREINSEKTDATHDVEKFKDAVLDGNIDRVNLMLGGLQHGILVRLTEAESRELEQLRPEIDGATLISLYARGRAADLAATCGEIVSLHNSATK